MDRCCWIRGIHTTTKTYKGAALLWTGAAGSEGSATTKTYKGAALLWTGAAGSEGSDN